MRMTLVVHIIAGSPGLMSGFIALYSANGAPLHRTPGIVFVYTMLTMSAAGLTMSIVRGVARGAASPHGPRHNALLAVARPLQEITPRSENLLRPVTFDNAPAKRTLELPA